MNVNVIFNPVSCDDLYFTGKNSVVIDVLRATSTIVTALDNGAKEIIPVATVEFAVKISGGMFGGLTLLCGERNTTKVEGFALGNSPLEFTVDNIKSKTIILFTTNGSKAIVKAKFSDKQYICSFLNLNAVAQTLVQNNEDVEILCAGNSTSFSLEDTVCAGRLISEMQKLLPDINLSDSAKASVSLNKTYGRNVFKMLKETEHGKILINKGYEKDVKYCSKLNISESVPVFSGNVIKLSPVK
jgi:2-phosphosulfolactate phosphatase